MKLKSLWQWSRRAPGSTSRNATEERESTDQNATVKRGQDGTKQHRALHLDGLKGLIALQAWVYAFFLILCPGVITDTAVDGAQPAAFLLGGPQWQDKIRTVMSPLLFDGSLQVSFFLVISARFISEGESRFFRNPDIAVLSRSIYLRPHRFVPLVAVAVASTRILLALQAFNSANRWSERLPSLYSVAPASFSSFQEYLYFLTSFFFSTHDHLDYRPDSFYLPPRNTSWALARTFQQSFTVYALLVILPFVRAKDRLGGLAAFALVAAWVGSWAWYSVSGVIISDLCHRGVLQSMSRSSWKVGQVAVRKCTFATCLFLVGAMLKYAGAVWPSVRKAELVAHAAQSTARLNHNFDTSQKAYPRFDNWFVVMAILCLVEMSPRMRKVLSSRLLRTFCKLSLALHLVSGLVIQTLGSELVEVSIARTNRIGTILSTKDFSVALAIAFILGMANLLIRAAIGAALP
ncbi:hypothetical protein IE81DRAFT_347054 [Ceraceosorus guamensis]|uniref:Acyltransferase 3 domain-containing protein n=1 Tax=Ceraceosorus guamensis TaxID=1522189 RepID=A0A316VYZ0_9BASI|nr:hypothetical protein IE81DRAFT_347054 [Ceraceosorus guamensis]PWN42877.1 hypothetical protein IE81DRAFT_347054 [Ceraceosorus guamensis]